MMEENHSATFDLDPPPSVNNAFVNVKGVGRVKSGKYKSWIANGLKELLAQRARPVQTPVAISMLIPETARADISNYAKGTEDLLVRAGVIPDDSKKFVRSISLTFHDSARMRVEVKTMDEAA